MLAMPPSKIAGALVEYQRAGLAEHFTDVGSVKVPAELAMRTADCDLSRYVGGHPMAGREQSGPLAADAGLFRGRPWVLTPSERTGGTVVELARQLIELCGACPVTMPAELHDRTVALTSHAPHLVSALIAGRLAQADDQQLRLAGRGLRDVTRIALGDPELWSDILRSNATAVLEVLREVADDLAVAVAALDWLGDLDPDLRRRGEEELRALLAAGVTGRGRLAERSPAQV